MEWHLYSNDQQSGPYSEEELFRQGREGILKNGDLVWNQDLIDWTAVEKIPHLLAVNLPETKNVGSEMLSEKETLIRELLAFDQAGPFQIARGSDTDLVVTNEVVNSSWFSGKKRVSYSARILLDEGSKTAFYWEMLKESSAGLSLQFGVQKKKIKGLELLQTNREKGFAPDGSIVYDYQFDYGSLREAFKAVLSKQGWKLKVVINKGKTNY